MSRSLSAVLCCCSLWTHFENVAFFVSRASCVVKNDGTPVVRLRAGWADTHPRALHLLRAEIDGWSKTALARPPRLVVTGDGW